MKTRLHVLAVLAALVLSAIWTGPVFADEQSPPPPGTVEEVPPPETDSPPESDTGDPPEPPEENSQPVEESLTDVLSQAPQGTEILVVDSEGEILPLASQEAADAIMEGDPMWCPVGVTPGGAGCTAPTNSFATMLANLTGMYGASGPSVAGVIWVESNYVSSIYDPLATEFVISGSSLTSMANFALTINGGWTGSGTTLDPNSPSVFNAALSIINWKADVTLKNILITGVTSGSSSNSAALDIQTTKKITLTNVKVEGNSDPGIGIVHGARLYNNDGSIASPVVVTNSEFNNNEGSGLIVNSDGAVTLKDVSANTNGLNGAWLVNTGASTAQAVTLTGTNIFSENGERGLLVQSKGAIKGNNLIANANGLLGVALINDTAAAAQPVALSGMNEFKFNGWEGLSIFSKGAVTLANITATYNSTGVYIDNTASPVGSNLTLSGTNLLRDNYYSGIEIFSNGAVSINNLSANGNGVSGSGYGYGAYIDNTTASAKPVALTGVNEFYFNQTGGLYIFSKGAITVYRLTASDTVAGIGAVLDNTSGNPLSPPNVALLVYANVNGNSSSGLLINSYGVVTLNNVTANDNGFYGVEVNNHTGSLPRAVVVNGTNNIHGNASTGLVVFSLGAVTLNNIHASGNTINGMDINNSGPNAVGGITLNGTSSFHGNVWNGIELSSRGAIVLKDLNATGNGRHGTFINNTSGTGNVTVGTNRVNWCNSFSDNGWSGLSIVSKGIVTVSNLCNYNNGNPSPGYGLLIQNNAAPTPKAVRLLGTNDFSGNFNDGVNISSKGAVTLNNINANDNGFNGVIVQNDADPNAPQNVTISGYGNFVNNGNNGLYIVSNGAVTLNRIYAADNTGVGINVNNLSGSTLPRGVTINGYAQAFNNNAGISISSLGAIRITNAEAAYNTGYGAFLDNDAPGAVGGITLLGTVNNFYENGTFGMFVLSRGLISLADPDAWNNSLFGVVLENTNGTAGVVLSTGNGSVFNGNGGVGLEVRTKGAITAAGLWAESNGGPGVYLRNYYSGPSSPQNVTLTGMNDFHLNGFTGLEIQSYGVITISNLNASDNSGYGAQLDNYRGDALTAKAVRLTGTSAFYGNDWTGLVIESLGGIIGSNISASSNGIYGASLNNQWNFGFFGVTLTGANSFDGNTNAGLYVRSNGAVSISNLSASWNTSNGAVIDTYNLNQLAAVTLTGRNYFLGNWQTGLQIVTNAAISLSNVMANWNGFTGAYLNNYDAKPNSGPGATIRISGTNYFNGNDVIGLYLLAFGHVYLYNITADYNDPANLNGGSGVVGDSHSGSILISCGSMTQNGVFGWALSAATTVTLKNVNAYGNGVANSFLASGTPIISRSCP